VRLPVAEPQRVRRLVLAPRQRLQAAPHDFGDVRRVEQNDRDLRAQQLVELIPSGMNSANMIEAMNSTVISGTPRTSSMYAIDTERMIGSCERRPSASRTPSGRPAASRRWPASA